MDGKIFPNKEACSLIELANEWASDQCYLHVEKLERHAPKLKQEENKVTLMKQRERVGKRD